MDVSTIGGVGLVRARLQGSDLLFIGGTKPYFAGAIVARPDITTVADLRGRRIGITAPGGNTDLMARALLPRLGLDPGRDVVLFATGGDPESVAALVSGGIESASLTPPADDRARNAGFPTLVDVTAERLPYPAAALGTAGPTLASRADDNRSQTNIDQRQGDCGNPDRRPAAHAMSSGISTREASGDG